MRRIVAALLLLSSPVFATAQEPVIGGPCEGCELVFVGQPEQIGSEGRIAPAAQAGEPLVLEGTVRTLDGAPAADVVVYAYQTDAEGIYPQASTPHGALRGWARSAADGRYRFLTIRPAAYPGRQIPQHIHLHVIEPGKGTYYIDDVNFSDDPLLTTRFRQDLDRRRGGNGVVTPTRDPAGVWHAERDITLGANVPGYRGS